MDDADKKRQASGGAKIFSVIAEELGLDIRTIYNIDLHVPAVPEGPMTATIKVVINRGMEDGMIEAIKTVDVRPMPVDGLTQQKPRLEDARGGAVEKL